MPNLNAYCQAHSTPLSPILYELERETHLKTLAPQMLSGPLQGQLLRLLSLMIRPRAVLEIGTFTGYSAICLAQGLAEDGILHTIEVNEELAWFGKKYFAKAGLSDRIVAHIGDALTIGAGNSLKTSHRFFGGAKKTEVIDAYQDSENIESFDLMIDWGWFYFITKPLFKLMNWLYHLIGNFGIAILVTTVIIKAVLFPLANMSYASMAKMKKVQPEMEKIKAKAGDDRLKMQQEMMALYKREKINPAAGCWPMLIQIPVFFALYKVIYVTIEMRHAPFFGWIQDLSAPDPTSILNLFGLLPFESPAFLAILAIGVWPLIMGITMFLQMQMNPAPPDPTQAMIFKWMPIMFTFMLATFPAGLVIYWAWNNTLSIIQQGVIMRKHGVKIELWDNLKGLFRRKAKSGSK